MMNEIRIHNFMETDIPYTDEELLNKLCRMYNDTPIKDISSLWFNFHFTIINILKEDVEDAYNEDGDNKIQLENYMFLRRLINDKNLLLIKNYAPDIYNTYEYNFDNDEYEYDDVDEYEINFFKKVFKPTLKTCADILNLHFKDRFDNYINEKDAELSGAETETETETETDTDE